jgi:putative ABC transport system substrate-binding protein
MIRQVKLGVLAIFMMLIYFSLFGCKAKDEIFHVGILQWTEKVQPYRQTYNGLLDGLKDKGYQDGMNLKIDYQNAEQDKALAMKIAEGFVQKEVNLIVALGTGSSLAALEATEKKQIPIVFSIVGAPKATGIIKDYNDSGRNITGVSMKIPVKEQLEMVKEALPEVKRLGIIYCTEMPQAVATGKEAASVAPDFGWALFVNTFPKDNLTQLQKIVHSLAQKVDAIYIPTDPILGTPENFKTVIRVSDMYKVPVITVGEKFVEDGALLAFHCDFYGIGRQASLPVVQVLKGINPRTIPSQLPTIKKLSLNLIKAQHLNITIRRNIILKADNIFD